MQSKKRTPPSSLSAHPAIPHGKSRTSNVLWEMVRPELDEAIASLSPLLREVIVLRYLEGLSLQLVAHRLNLPMRSTATQVQRALDRLRIWYKRVRISISTTSLAVLLTENGIETAPFDLSAKITENCLHPSKATHRARETARKIIQQMDRETRVKRR